MHCHAEGYITGIHFGSSRYHAQRARSFVGTTYLCIFETYTVVALIYLVITLILSKCVSHMEGRLNFYDGK